MDKHSVIPSMESKKPKFFYGYIIVVAGFFILALMWGIIQSFGVFLKPMSVEFGWTRAMTSGAYSTFMFLLGLLFTVTGRITDKFGPRIVATVCSVFFGLAYLLMSQMSALWQLYLFFGVMVAIGASGGFVPLVATVARWFIKRRGLMTGLFISGFGAGAVVGPPVCVWLISSYGWRTSYFIIGIVTMVLLIVSAQFLRRDPSQVGQLPDGDSEVKKENMGLEAKGLSLREAIHTRQFRMFFLMFFFFGIGQMAMLVHIVPHATDLGISPIIAANILSVVGGLNVAGRIGMGSISDRIGSKPSLVISLVVFSVALLWLLVAKELWMFYLFAVIFGFGIGSVVALMSPVAAEVFGMRAHAAILGMLAFAECAGSAVGPVVAGHIFDIMSSYYLAFIIFVVLSFASLVLALFLRRAGRKGWM